MDAAFDKKPIDVVVGLPRLLFVVPLCRVNAPSCGLYQNKGPSEVELSTGQILLEINSKMWAVSKTGMPVGIW